jgi:lysophospholipase L1-like esterase
MTNTSRHPRLSKRKLLLFSVISIVLFFGLVEVVVRLTLPPVNSLQLIIELPGQIVDRDVSIFESDPVLFWKLRPGIKEEWWDYTVVSTNSSGFRYPRDFSKRKGHDTIRILCLGDSITFGYRVAYQNTFPLILERTLQQAFPDKKFEVIPFAVPGYTSFQGYLLFKSLGISLRPDCVIINFGWNDVWKEDCSDREAFQRSAPLRGLRSVLRHSQAYLHLCKWSSGLRKKNQSQIKKRVARVSKEEYVRNFQLITQLAKKAGARVIWFAPMIQYITGETKDIPAYRQELRKAAQKNAVPFLNIPLFTEEKSSENKDLFGECIHPNDRGHYLLAQALLRFLLESHALPLTDARLSSFRKQYEEYYSPPKRTSEIPEGEENLRPGLLGRLYSGITPHGDILYASADAPIDFTWYNDLEKPLAPPFCISWQGFVKITEDGEYEFATRSDDGSQLWIDAQLVVNNSGQHGPIITTGKMYLTKGLHPIELTYYDFGFGATIRLLWAQPGNPLEIIPARVLFH